MQLLFRDRAFIIKHNPCLLDINIHFMCTIAVKTVYTHLCGWRIDEIQLDGLIFRIDFQESIQNIRLHLLIITII